MHHWAVKDWHRESSHVSTRTAYYVTRLSCATASERAMVRAICSNHRAQSHKRCEAFLTNTYSYSNGITSVLNHWHSTVDLRDLKKQKRAPDSWNQLHSMYFRTLIPNHPHVPWHTITDLGFWRLTTYQDLVSRRDPHCMTFHYFHLFLRLSHK